jgi:hypothetical protein
MSRENEPFLQAVIVNDCGSLADIFVTFGYYDASGTQIDHDLENSTVVSGTKWKLVHVPQCARYVSYCTPEQWQAQIRIIDVTAYKK